MQQQWDLIQMQWVGIQQQWEVKQMQQGIIQQQWEFKQMQQGIIQQPWVMKHMQQGVIPPLWDTAQTQIVIFLLRLDVIMLGAAIQHPGKKPPIEPNRGK